MGGYNTDVTGFMRHLGFPMVAAGLLALVSIASWAIGAHDVSPKGLSASELLQSCPADVKESVRLCLQWGDYRKEPIEWLAKNAEKSRSCVRNVLMNAEGNMSGLFKAYLRMSDEHLALRLGVAYANTSTGADENNFYWTIKKQPDILSSADLMWVATYFNIDPIPPEYWATMLKRGTPNDIRYPQEFLLFTGSEEAAKSLVGQCDPATADAMSLYWFKPGQEFSDYFAKCDHPNAKLIRDARENVRYPVQPRPSIENIKQFLSGIGRANGLPDSKLLILLRDHIASLYHFNVFPRTGSSWDGLYNRHADTPSVQHYASLILKRRPWIVQRAMILAAATFYGEPQLDELAKFILAGDSVHPWVKAAACEVAPLGIPENEAMVAQLTQSRDIYLRVTAIRSLGAAGKAPSALDPATRSFLSADSLFEREAARDVLISLLPNKGAAETLESGLSWDMQKDLGPRTRLLSDMADKLIQKGIGGRPELLRAILSVPRVAQGHTRQILQGCDRDTVHAVAKPLLDSPIRKTRLAAQDLITNLGLQSGKKQASLDDAIETIFKGTEEASAHQAENLLVQYGGPREAKILARALMTKKPLKRRYMALDILGRLGGVEAGRAMMQHIREGHTDGRTQAILGLGKLREPSLDREIKQLLESIANSKDWCANYATSVLRDLKARETKKAR